MNRKNRFKGKKWERVHGPDIEPRHKETYFKREELMTNPEFLSACNAARIPATPRQARKWLMRKGLAYANRRHHANAVAANSRLDLAYAKIQKSYNRLH
jgi:hypothetical protein